MESENPYESDEEENEGDMSSSIASPTRRVMSKMDK